MLVRRRQALEVLSISALDIFASALGVFVLMAILLFPYYLKQPSIEADRAGAEAELAAAADDIREAREALEQALEERASAETALAEAEARLERAKAAAERPAQAPEIEAPPPAQAGGEQKVRLAISDLDLVFVMDTTGSMRRELADLQAGLVGIIRVLHRLASSLQIGFVAFKDRGEAYLTRGYSLRRMNDAHVAELVGFVRDLSARGGGDDPEPIDEALAVALEMPWRSGAQGRIIVVGDAPPRARERTLELAARFRRSAAGPAAPRTVSAIYTGDNLLFRSFFEQLAAAGGGDFSVHQGQMTESILLSVLKDAVPEGAAP